MLIQGPILSYIYSRIFAGEPIVKGAAKFMCLVIPLAWSYAVFAVAAKHQMTSSIAFAKIEIVFVIIHYALFAPILAAIYAKAELPSRRV
jgi:hypothetical protein